MKINELNIRFISIIFYRSRYLKLKKSMMPLKLWLKTYHANTN